MILIEIGFGAAEPGLQRRHDCSIQPFVRMQYDRQHPFRIGAVENRLVHCGFSLARKDLADISEPRQSFASDLTRTDRLEGICRFRSLIQGGTAEVNGNLQSCYPVRDRKSTRLNSS